MNTVAPNPPTDNFPPQPNPINGEASEAELQLSSSDFISSYRNYADVLEVPAEAHEWVAIQLIAAVLNSKVSIKYGSLPASLDLWLLLLSHSGMGRNTLLNTVRPVLKEAGLDHLIRQTSWGSPQALYQGFAENPYGLSIWPEFGEVMKKFENPAFGGIKEWIVDRFDNSVLPDKITYRRTGKKTDTPPIVFEQAPRLNLLATSSLDWFVGNLQREDSTGGYLPRWLIVTLPEPRRLVPKPAAFDPSLVKPLAEHLRKASLLSGVADLSRVEEIYAEWYKPTHERFTQQTYAALALPFFNRLRTQVLKLAVISEVSRSLTLQVSPEAMTRAIEIAQRLEKTIFKLLPTGMNREGHELEKMSSLIKVAGSNGISLNKFTRAFQHVRAGERNQRLYTLNQANTIQAFNRQTSGRKKIILVHRNYLETYSQQFPEDSYREKIF